MGRTDQSGYTFIELLVAAAVLLLLTALTCVVLVEAKTAMEVSGERADVQQRARAGIEGMLAAVREAGVGSDRGIRAGPLIQWIPPVWPGQSDRSEPWTGVTTLLVVADIAPATLVFDAPAGTTTLNFDRAGCALPCGFTDGMTVIVLDGRGDFDVFVLLETDGSSATVRRVSGGTNASYARGSAVLPAELRTYYWNTRARELRRDDGDRGDFPAVSDVVSVSFEYYGDPFPPLHPRPPAGEENCLYDSFGTPRAGMAVLPPAGATLAPLDVSLFEDGPWCGSGAEPFDADLLRIRSLRIALRTQTSNRGYRGPDSRLFQNPGSATSSARFVKDVILQTTVTPRNLGGWR